MSTAGKAVFLSALTVVMALAAVFLVPVMVFRSMALGMILSVVAVAAASLTLLPAVARRARRPRPRQEEHRRPRHHRREPLAARGPASSLRRPGTVLAVGLVVLGALIAPALGMHLGMPGAHVVDKGNTSRDGYDMLVNAFGPGAAAPVFITTPGARRRPPSSQVASTACPASSTPASSPRPQRPAASSCASPARPPSTTPGPRRSSTPCAADLHTAVPDARRRRTRRAEPRPHRRAHRTGALRDRADPHRRVRAAARRVPQPRRRAHVDPA